VVPIFQISEFKRFLSFSMACETLLRQAVIAFNEMYLQSRGRIATATLAIADTSLVSQR